MRLTAKFLNILRTISPALASEFLQLVTAINQNFRLVTIPYVSTNFDGNGAMTWTVLSSHVEKLYYRKTGSIVTLWVLMSGTTVGGTPNTALQIRLPLEISAKQESYDAGHASDNAVGTACVGKIVGTLLQIFRADVANWTAGTTAVRLRMEYEV